MEWLFERVAPPPGARLLEVGCGSAALWRANVDRIDPSWSLTLTDLSPGMIESARAALGERADYAVADAQELPFADPSFDVVVANHMLYHVSDRPKALAEIARVLVPGGVLHAATNGRGHLRELRDLVGLEWSLNRIVDEFRLENGAEQLGEFFVDVRVERFDVGLAVTEVEPVLAYVRSSGSFPDGSLERVRDEVAAAIAREAASGSPPRLAFSPAASLDTAVLRFAAMEGTTVGEAAAQTGWSARMLRYLERNRLVVPHRSASGYRLYGLRELNQLRSLASCGAASASRSPTLLSRPGSGASPT